MTSASIAIAPAPAERRPARRRITVGRVLVELAAPLAAAIFLVLWIFAELGRTGSDGAVFFVAAAAYAVAIPVGDHRGDTVGDLPQALFAVARQRAQALDPEGTARTQDGHVDQRQSSGGNP